MLLSTHEMTNLAQNFQTKLNWPWKPQVSHKKHSKITHTSILTPRAAGECQTENFQTCTCILFEISHQIVAMYHLKVQNGEKVLRVTLQLKQLPMPKLEWLPKLVGCC